MTAIAWGLAFAALALERIAYTWVWHRPHSFERFCARTRLGQPVDALRRLFYVFKAIQVAVFAGWIAFYGGWLDGSFQLLSSDWRAISGGLVLVAGGQVLNWSVFHRLGKVGVFYGCRFGHDVDWVRGFPFSLVAHPQYVGTALTVWGVFLATRFPHPDWLVLPLLETVYYAAAIFLERNFSDTTEEEVEVEELAA